MDDPDFHNNAERKIVLYSLDTGEDTGNGWSKITISAQINGDTLTIEEYSTGRTWDTSERSSKYTITVSSKNLSHFFTAMSASHDDILKKMTDRFTGYCFDEMKAFLKSNHIPFDLDEQW